MIYSPVCKYLVVSHFHSNRQCCSDVLIHESFCTCVSFSRIIAAIGYNDLKLYLRLPVCSPKWLHIKSVWLFAFFYILASS